MQKRKTGQPHKGWKSAARQRRKRDHTFEVVQDGMVVASATSTDREAAFDEAMHYAFVYQQGGPVLVRAK